jgi:hypothetical protein
MFSVEQGASVETPAPCFDFRGSARRIATGLPAETATPKRVYLAEVAERSFGELARVVSRFPHFRGTTTLRSLALFLTFCRMYERSSWNQVKSS